jgi:hypothetical protein
MTAKLEKSFFAAAAAYDSAFKKLQQTSCWQEYQKAKFDLQRSYQNFQRGPIQSGLALLTRLFDHPSALAKAQRLFMDWSRIHPDQDPRAPSIVDAIDSFDQSYFAYIQDKGMQEVHQAKRGLKDASIALFRSGRTFEPIGEMLGGLSDHTTLKVQKWFMNWNAQSDAEISR